MAMLIGTNAADVAHTLTRVARRRVVYVESVGDAASRVWLVAGPYSRQIGQAADWRHHVAAAAEQNDALYVEGSYDDTRWVVGVPEEYADVLCRELGVITVGQERRREEKRAEAVRKALDGADAERPAREAAAAAYRAECAAREAEYRPLYEQARARVRTAARGRARRDDLQTLEWAYAKACGTRDSYGDYDRGHGLAVLRRLAAEGFGPAALVGQG